MASRRSLPLLCALLLGPAAASAQPVVLELFTSQGCSSCPPADALLTELARQPDVLALDLHVDYWDRLGWRDPFSSAAFTQRQRRYASLLGQDEIYTPELVVGGTQGVVGSDRAAVAAAIQAARIAPQVMLQLRRETGQLVVQAGAGPGSATLWLAGFDPHRETQVGRGENGGRHLVEANVVRSLTTLADWLGTPLQLAVAPPAGEAAAVFLQRADGRIIGAAMMR
jgi:hypothetical protein